MCRWKSGTVKAAYKNSYMHANVGMDMFESRVCAATVLRFVMPVMFMLVLFIKSVQFWFHTGIFIISPTEAVAKYCDEHICACVSVSDCPRGYLRNRTRDLYLIFYACCLWPWLCPPPASSRIAIRYVLPVFWMTSSFFYNGPYSGMNFATKD